MRTYIRGDTMITAYISNYKKAYRKLHEAALKMKDDKQFDYVRCMILFYSAECGLKSILLYRWGCYSKKDMENLDKEQKQLLGTHDLKKMLYELHQNSSFSFPDNMKTNDGERIDVREFHQVCRYNIRLQNDSYFDMMGETLIKIDEWANEQI